MDKNINNEKKYGVMWANTINLGDDVQTLAAINFLEKKNLKAEVFVNREELINYDGPDINLIMNGWFMHDINKFPPSEKITPIFISFHCANLDLITNNLGYFKKHQPIGCRDTATVQLFQKCGIEAYFTGCLTLYFNKHLIKTQNKYIVDINTCKYIPKVEFDKNKYQNYNELTHDLAEKEDRNDLFYRLDKARELLKKYAEAEEVITSRLHVALPCRAFGTKVVFVHSNLDDPRFSGLCPILLSNSDNDTIGPIVDMFDKYQLD